MAAPSPTGNSRSLSYWIDTVPPTSERSLVEDERADVAIVGGGIAGLTAAYLLAKAGKDVVLMERDRIGMAETGHTTAHLQCVDDTRLSQLVDDFGMEEAKRVWEGHFEAVRTIESIVEENRIQCGLERLDAYLWSPLASEGARLRQEMRLARAMGFAAEQASPTDVPFTAAHVVRFPHQGKFHVRRYLLGLLKAAKAKGARVYELTDVSSVEGGREVTLTTRGGARVKADWFLCCTNTPIVGRETMHAKLEPYRTYAIGMRVPRGIFRDALYWDTADPYHYTRVESGVDLPGMGGHDLVIHGGEDHLVGDIEDTDARWGKLRAHLQGVSLDAELLYRWSGEVIETADGLPYIGRIVGRGENELMVTGDSGTGMTHGTLGALMLTERVLGRGTPWDKLYDPARVEADLSVGKELLKYNTHVAKRFVKGALMRSELGDIADLQKGDGAIFKLRLRPVAVARLDDGRVCAVSGACTHVGCTVAWNHGEQSWDCPCHGSRFAPTGEVLHGPANKPLAPVPLDELLSKREKRVQG